MLHYWHQKLFSLCLILTWTAAELPRDSRLLPRPHNILAVDVVVFMYTCHSQRSLPLPSHSQAKENAPTGISVKFNEFTDSDVGAGVHHFEPSLGLAVGLGWVDVLSRRVGFWQCINKLTFCIVLCFFPPQISVLLLLHKCLLIRLAACAQAVPR